MPIAITIDKCKIFSVVILVFDQIVKDHHSIDLPQFSNTMCKYGADLKNMCVVYAWHTIVCTNKACYTYYMQFAFWCSIEALNTKIFLIE